MRKSHMKLATEFTAEILSSRVCNVSVFFMEIQGRNVSRIFV